MAKSLILKALGGVKASPRFGAPKGHGGRGEAAKALVCDDAWTWGPSAWLHNPPGAGARTMAGLKGGEGS